MIMINGPIPKIKSPTADVVAAVVEGEKKPAGQASESRRSAKSGIESNRHGPNVDHAATNARQRRRHDVADPLMGVGGHEPPLPYRFNEAIRQRVRQAAQLQAGARRELEITAAELLCDPAQPA